MRKLAYLIVSIFIVLSCKKADDESEIAQDTIQPLGVGYYWEYIDSTFSETGLLVNVDTSRLGITGKSVINYKEEELELFYWNWYDNDLQEYRNFKFICNNGEEGFYFYGGMTDEKTYILGKTLNIKYPVKINDSWNRVEYVYTERSDSSYFFISDTITIVCDAVNELFMTATGGLNCYRYHNTQEMGEDVEDIYFYQALDIGYVGYVRKWNGVIRYKKTLLSYNLTNSPVKKTIKSASGKSENQPYETIYGPYK